MNLIKKTKELVEKEKFYTARVIEHLQLIEDKKSYGELGYSSLYEFCLKELGYSPMQATVRVNCVRICKKHPQLKSKIDDGKINPTSASKMQSFFNKHNINEETQEEIIKKVEGKSTRQTEKELLEYSSKPIEKSIILNERLLKKMAKLSQMMGDCSEVELIEMLIEEKIREIEKRKPTRVSKRSFRQRYIPRKIKEAVSEKSNHQCQYVSRNGRRCQVKSNLQFDHIRPIYLGGQSTIDNIQILCFTHNQLKNIKANILYNQKSLKVINSKQTITNYLGS